MLLTRHLTTQGASQIFGSLDPTSGESDSEGGPGTCILAMPMQIIPGPHRQAPSGTVVLMTQEVELNAGAPSPGVLATAG